MSADGTSYVYIAGQRHEIVSTDSLENLAWSADIEIIMPPGAGWATTAIGEARFAAFVEAPVTS